MHTLHTFNEAIEAAAAGEYDLIVSCHNINEDRLKVVEYSIPYREDGMAILSRKSFNIEDFLLYRIIQTDFCSSASRPLPIKCCRIRIVYKIDFGNLNIRDFSAEKRAQLMKIWTMFMVSEYGDRSSMTKGMPVIIFFFFIRLAVITSLVGSSVSEVFNAEKPKTRIIYQMPK